MNTKQINLDACAWQPMHDDIMSRYIDSINYGSSYQPDILDKKQNIHEKICKILDL
jgi:hypothetical protein